jgi:tellurite resistance protein
MGLFDGFRGPTEKKLSADEAIMTVVLGAIMADGEVDDDEVTRLKAMCVLSPIYARNTSERDRNIVQRALNQVSQDGEQAMRRAAAALSPALRETAFAFACDMVLADGVLAPSEERFVEQLAETLELAPALARAIVQVTLIRNRDL